MHALPPLRRDSTALFLDFDGTLADLAPQPEAVQIPATLVPLLNRLSTALGGALALVSGRRLSDLDGFLAPLVLPAAAEHGALRRTGDGALHLAEVPDLRAVSAAAEHLAAKHVGLRVETKSAAIALHYRHAPELEGLCLATLQEAVRRHPDIALVHGKCVVEAKPASVSKGKAIAAFMSEAPFIGRTPLFAGDDTTDEAGFDWVQSQGGMALKVGMGPSLARHRCTGPAALRAWLEAGLQQLERSSDHPTRSKA
ncbi:MAG: trehalose-phosphatase [Pseudomonadota bacterium]